jgi:hypothetical protein
MLELDVFLFNLITSKLSNYFRPTQNSEEPIISFIVPQNSEHSFQGRFLLQLTALNHSFSITVFFFYLTRLFKADIFPSNDRQQRELAQH